MRGWVFKGVLVCVCVCVCTLMCVFNCIRVDKIKENYRFLLSDMESEYQHCFYNSVVLCEYNERSEVQLRDKHFKD